MSRKFGLRNHTSLAEQHAMVATLTEAYHYRSGLYARCEHTGCLAWESWWREEGYQQMPSGDERLASLRAFWRDLRRRDILAGHRCPTERVSPWMPPLKVPPPPLVLGS